MILHLEEEVNGKMFNLLVKALNELKVDDNLAIYFTSEGGLTDTSIAIVDLINKNKDRIGITFYGEIFSAGMYIFLATECEKWILMDTRGMFHFSWQDMTIREGGKPSQDYDKFCFKEMKLSEKKTLDFLKVRNLTDKEILGIKKGRDVYFSNERLQQIINDTK